MQSVTLKIRKKGKLSCAEIIEKKIFDELCSFQRSQKRGEVVINVCDVFRSLNPSYGFRKTS